MRRRCARAGFAVSIVPMPPAVMSTTRESPLRGVAAIPPAIRAAADVLRAVRADVVHTNTIKAHAVALPAARLTGIPHVAHLRDILSGRGRLAIRAVLALCSRERIAISQAVCSAFDLNATHVIHNPLVLDDYGKFAERQAEARRALGLPLDVALVSIVGRINRWKGHDRLLRIAEAHGVYRLRRPLRRRRCTGVSGRRLRRRTSRL